MRRFWDLLRESVITRAIIALILVITACYLAIQQQPIPDWLFAVLGTVIGSFFGPRSVAAVK